jgi:hypothetical protein
MNQNQLNDATTPRSVDQQQACSAWIDPTQRQPKYTGKYLVWTSEGPEILRIEEGFICYADGEPADWDHITAWAEVQKPNKD